MIKTVEFMDFRGYPNIERNDCIILKSSNFTDRLLITVAFPFHEDTPNFTLTVPEALSIRNAIDELCAIKMIGEPEVVRMDKGTTVFPMGERVNHIGYDQQRAILDLLAQHNSNSKRDKGARQAILKVLEILNIKGE